MAGIYIHIPFCKSNCSYCDFYSVVKQDSINELLSAYIKEIQEKKTIFDNQIIETIYFGGGTPSYVDFSFILNVLDEIFLNFKIIEKPEITIEVNPDDVNFKFLENLKQSKINRVSLGIQSLNNKTLRFLNRRHDNLKALSALIQIIDLPINNISCDLIYGLPNQSLKDIEIVLEKFVKLKVNHVSAYHITYEKGTKLYKLLQKKQFESLSDENSYIQYNFIKNYLMQNNIFQYEISNFAMINYESKHNTSYWEAKKYIGIGPSAHSFFGNIRQWNISNINKYIEYVTNNKKHYKSETINLNKAYNEFILTNIRLNKGIDSEKILKLFGISKFEKFEKEIKKIILQDLAYKFNNNYCLTTKGQFISDNITLNLID